MRVTFPFPPKELSPNSRLHWAKRAKAVKSYRQECMIIARNAGLRVDWPGQVHLWVTFFRPNRRRYDDDGLFSRFKAGRDGIADALGIDDNRFLYRPYLHDEVRPGGEVVVALTPGPKTDTYQQAEAAGLAG